MEAGNAENNTATTDEGQQSAGAEKTDFTNRKKRSPIWKHFTTKYVTTANGLEEYAFCNLCDR